MRFRARVEPWSSGSGWAIIKLTDEQLARIGASTHTPVVATIFGHPIRTTVMRYKPIGAYIVINRRARDAARVEAGEIVTVTLVVDTAPRTAVLPRDLRAAMTPKGRARWDRLSPSDRRAVVQHLDDAKKPETRARRVSKWVERLETV